MISTVYNDLGVISKGKLRSRDRDQIWREEDIIFHS
jgi:hypothetical protein